MDIHGFERNLRIRLHLAKGFDESVLNLKKKQISRLVFDHVFK